VAAYYGSAHYGQDHYGQGGPFVSNPLTWTVEAPPCTLSSLTPSNTTAGSGLTAITITGAGFVSGATGTFGGNAKTVTYVSATQVTMTIIAADIATAGTYVVVVSNPGVAASNALSFSVAPAATTYPSITSLSPPSATAGGAGFTLTINGSNFLSAGGSVAQWGSAALTTTYVSATQLTAAVPAGDIMVAGTDYVSVVNGSLTSNNAAFAVTPVAATIDEPAFVLEIAFNAPTFGMWILGAGALGTATGTTNTALGGPYSSAQYQPIDGLRSFTVARGRQHELATLEAGTCDLLVDNRNGYLSPDYGGSPYSPNVLPRRRMRLSAVWQGTVYMLFTGFIQAITPIENTPADADVRLHCVDWLALAALQKLTASLPAQGDASRVGSLLAVANTTGAVQVHDGNESNFIATSLVNIPAAQHLQDIQTSARGLFLVGRDGTLAYENRNHRFTDARGATVQATFGQVNAQGQYPAGTLPFRDIVYTLDDQFLFNEVRVNASGTAEGEQVVTDVPSIQLSFTSTLQVDAKLLDTGQALYIAQGLLTAYKTPYPRLSAIVLNGADTNDDSMWPVILGFEISDKLHVQKASPGYLNYSRDVFVEKIEYQYDKAGDGLQATLQVSDARVQGPVPWILGTSALGTTTVLGT